MEFSIEPTAEDELEIVLTEDNDEESPVQEPLQLSDE